MVNQYSRKIKAVRSRTYNWIDRLRSGYYIDNYISDILHTCNTCGIKKWPGEFHRDARAGSGRRASCKECELDKKRQYYIDNREEHLERQRRWRKNNLDKLRVRNQRRRAREIGAEGSYTQEEWEEKCRLQDHLCAICGDNVELTVDHIIPLSRGGSNDIENIQGLCGPCNYRKGDKILGEV